MHARTAPSSPPALAFHVDAFEQVIELALLDRNDARISQRLRNPKHSAVQPLVKNAQSASIEEQDLQRAFAPPDEQEQRAAARRALHALLRQTRQSIESQAHVHGLKRDEDLH